MDAKSRIIKVLNYMSLSPYEMAMRTGLKPTRIVDLTRGKVKNVTMEVAEAICGIFPNISKDWLRYGIGEMLEPDEEKVEIPDFSAEAIQRAKQSIALLEEVLAQARENAAILRKSQDLFERVLDLYNEKSAPRNSAPYAVAEDIANPKKPRKQPQK